MDKKHIIKSEIISLIACLILSVVFHFIFEWSNNNVILGAFFPVNESIWEHSKLIFMPFLLVSVIMYFFTNKHHNYVFAKALCLSISIPLMIILFYTYSGILGYNVMWVDILITLIVFASLSYLSYRLRMCEKTYNPRVPIVIAVLFYLACIVFTYYTPQINLFRDPTNNTFGIFKK